MPAPSQEESKGPKPKKQQTIRRAGENDADGPNPLKKLKFFDQETLDFLREKFDSVST